MSDSKNVTSWEKACELLMVQYGVEFVPEDLVIHYLRLSDWENKFKWLYELKPHLSEEVFLQQEKLILEQIRIGLDIAEKLKKQEYSQ